MRTIVQEKHWWIGLILILTAIAVNSIAASVQPSAEWLVRELPTYAMFFLGALWTTYFSQSHHLALGLSHLSTVICFVVAMVSNTHSKDVVMEQNVASRAAERLVEFDKWFNDMTNLSLEMEHGEGKELRQSLAAMLFAIDHGLRKRLRREFPDLIHD